MNKKSKWRYIDTGCRSALFNMSFDKALFDSFDPDNHSPVFRLYQWSQPSISLGNFQNPDNIIDIKECESRDVQIVKRITGGGALYHNNELTYSIICSCDTFSSKSVKESYKELCGFLILTYKKLGLDPGFAVESKKLNSYKKNRHICMSGIEDYDITINGNKIGGNAQKRTRDKIFQHGSIPFKFNFNEVINLFKNKPKNLPAPCSLDDFKIKIDLKQLKNIVKSSFEENLNMHLTENDLLIVKNIMKQKEVINV